MKIKVLPDIVVNQISAGEVVERPSSVVRELVENALDAGAADIAVILEQGGHSLIRIVDNGCGMERDDALLALERHATSKISAADDLLNIHTLGFRGEALPSIAAVAKLRIRTRIAEHELGTEVVVHGGAIKAVQPVACTLGTEIEVRSLFFNTPARRKFLKSPRNEELRVRQWLTGTALAHPQVRLRLTLDGREVLNLPRRATSAERAEGLFRGAMVPFEESDAYGTAACGVAAHPSQASADAGSFLILVNGRVVSDRLILKAVKEGFSSTLKDREFPIGYISLSVTPAKVDVNVHPQKSEVRFADPQSIFLFVRGALLRATAELRAPLSYAQVARYPAATPPETAAYVQAPGVQAAFDYRPAASAPALSLQIAEGGGGAAEFEATPKPSFRFSDLRYIGQALQCYLFCEYDGSLYVVDMHAAHERYNYNLIRNSSRAQSVSSQQLLMPMSVDVGQAGIDRFRENREIFVAYGFMIEESSETALLIRAIPALLVGHDAAGVVRESVALEEGDVAGGALSEYVDRVAARIACHASVRSGKNLCAEEAYALFAALDRTEFSAACPHGRPIIVRFGESDIERWFGRDR